MRLAAVLWLCCAPVAAAEFDRTALEDCLRSAPEGSSGSECMVPVRHQCNSLLEGGTMTQDIACLERAATALSRWSDEIMADLPDVGLTGAGIADYRRRLRGFCLGQMESGSEVHQVAFGLCELAGHAALHRDILRRKAVAE
jgi:hypothetical protein